MSEPDPAFMREALAEADRAAAAGEVPVGAVVVHQGRIVGRGHNRSVGQHDVTAHAEIEAIRQASRALGNYRLDGCEIYVTLEPCAMCSGAILGARLKRLVYGASEPRTGAAGSVTDLYALSQLNHHTQVQGGLLAPQCSERLQGFFQGRRQQQQADRQQRFLRDDALRPPAERLPRWPDGMQSLYMQDLPSLQGLRLHVLRAGQGSDASPWHGGQAVLALHGPAQWSAAFAASAPALSAAGRQLWAPDLVGFGLSDKPKKAAWHRLERHVQVLCELIAHIPGQRLTLVFVPSAWALAAPLMRAPQVAARLDTVARIDEPPLAPDWAALPYPEASHRVGPQAWSDLLAAQAADEVPPRLPHFPGPDWPARLADQAQRGLPPASPAS